MIINELYSHRRICEHRLVLHILANGHHGGANYQVIDLNESLHSIPESRFGVAIFLGVNIGNCSGPYTRYSGRG
jgi:hypothetical protein